MCARAYMYVCVCMHACMYILHLASLASPPPPAPNILKLLTSFADEETVAQTSVSRKKVVDAYPESSKARFFAQIIFEHSVFSNSLRIII